MTELKRCMRGLWYHLWLPELKSMVIAEAVILPTVLLISGVFILLIRPEQPDGYMLLSLVQGVFVQAVLFGAVFTAGCALSGLGKVMQNAMMHGATRKHFLAALCITDVAISLAMGLLSVGIAAAMYAAAQRIAAALPHHADTPGTQFVVLLTKNSNFTPAQLAAHIAVLMAVLAAGGLMAAVVLAALRIRFGTMRMLAGLAVAVSVGLVLGSDELAKTSGALGRGLFAVQNMCRGVPPVMWLAVLCAAAAAMLLWAVWYLLRCPVRNI